MDTTGPFISVVMCTRNRSDLIGQAVQSVLNCDYPRFELIVVDQSDNTDTQRVVSGLPDPNARVRYIYSETPGLSRAYNAGLKTACGSIVAFTDDDCVVPTDWLEQVATAFETHPDVGLLYGQVICPDELRGAVGVVPELHFRRRELVGGKYGFRVIGMGANFAARAHLLQRVGGFDEVLGGGGALKSSQDFDLQYRVDRSGAMTLLEPDVWVWHYGLREPGQWNSTLLAYGVGDGAFYMKHARCRDPRALAMLGRILVRQSAAAVIKPLTGRRHNLAYFRGVIAGARGSFAFTVDRRARLYRV